MPRRTVQHLLIGSSLFFPVNRASCGAGALKSCLEARVFRLEDGVSEQRAPPCHGRPVGQRVCCGCSCHCTARQQRLALTRLRSSHRLSFWPEEKRLMTGCCSAVRRLIAKGRKGVRCGESQRESLRGDRERAEWVAGSRSSGSCSCQDNSTVKETAGIRLGFLRYLLTDSSKGGRVT